MDTDASIQNQTAVATGMFAPAMDRRVTRRGRILSGLSIDERERLQRHEELVAMPRDRVLWDSGERVDRVFFPVDCIVALMLELGDGKTVEVATVGNEGLVGLTALLGEARTPHRALVVRAGCAHRIPARVVELELSRGGEMQGQLLRYAQALVVETSYIAACNRHHAIHQQVCRLLLSRADRSRSSMLDLTHEALARSLGVRREGVTQTLGQLERAGLIRGSRGRIVVLDRAGLEGEACECYRAVRAAFENLRVCPHYAGTEPALRTGS